ASQAPCGGSPRSRPGPRLKHYRVSVRDVLDVHQRALETGGAHSIFNADAIYSAIGRPYTGYYRHIWSKAAALTHSLVTNHGFTDGNKRTALLTVHLLVERSG